MSEILNKKIYNKINCAVYNAVNGVVSDDCWSIVWNRVRSPVSDIVSNVGRSINNGHLFEK